MNATMSVDINIEQCNGCGICAEMTARASLKRNETRWGVSDYRSDFPQRDDENWLKFVDVEMDHDSGKMVVSTSPVKRRESREAK